MSKHKPQKLLVISAGVIVITSVTVLAYAVYLHDKPHVTVSQETKPIQNKDIFAERQQRQYPAYMVIKEWDKKIGLGMAISDATYHFDDNAVWLSTSKLDQDKACYDPAAQQPTFAGIIKHAPNDVLDVDVTSSQKDSMMASQAAEQNPYNFRVINDSVYEYKLNYSARPCDDLSKDQVNAFTDAWLSLR